MTIITIPFDFMSAFQLLNCFSWEKQKVGNLWYFYYLMIKKYIVCIQVIVNNRLSLLKSFTTSFSHLRKKKKNQSMRAYTSNLILFVLLASSSIRKFNYNHPNRYKTFVVVRQHRQKTIIRKEKKKRWWWTHIENRSSYTHKNIFNKWHRSHATFFCMFNYLFFFLFIVIWRFSSWLLI